jgi:hypothetical protein
LWYIGSTITTSLGIVHLLVLRISSCGLYFYAFSKPIRDVIRDDHLGIGNLHGPTPLYGEARPSVPRWSSPTAESVLETGMDELQRNKQPKGY